jgi:hypothetical protein
MFWHGNSKPSVEVPVGDFFGPNQYRGRGSQPPARDQKKWPTSGPIIASEQMQVTSC